MDTKYEIDLFSKIKTLNKFDIVIFLIPFLIFLYYLHVFDPGLVWFDSFKQLHQIATGKFTNWHPFFHTFIEMICVKLTGTTASVGLLQIITFSTMWMVICKYNRDDTQKSKKTLILQIIFTLIIALIPINAIYSITLLKDILFSYFMMFLCFLFQVLIDRKGQTSFIFIVVMSIVMAFITQLRLNGMYVVIPLLVILAIYLYRKGNTNKAFIIIPALTIIVILLIGSLGMVYNVKDLQLDGVRDVVTHILADYDLHLDLNKADRDKIHKLMNETAIKDSYNDSYKDPLRNDAIKPGVWKKDKMTYIKMAIKYSVKNPGYFIQHMFKAAPLAWQITRDDSWASNNAPIYSTPDTLEKTKVGFYERQNQTPLTTYDNASATQIGTAEYNILDGWALFAKENPIVSTIFNSPALYMYLSIILMAALYLITRLKEIWLVFLPNLLNIITIFISIPAQHTRYLYPNLLVFYLLVIILIGVLMKGQGKTSSVPANAQSPEEMEAMIREKVMKELEDENKPSRFNIFKNKK